MNRFKTSYLSQYGVFATLFLLSISAGCQSEKAETDLEADTGAPNSDEPSDLTHGSWVIVDSVDNAGNVWDGSTLTFTSQVENGQDFDLIGQFYWAGTPTNSHGTEHLVGTLFANGDMALQGTHLEDAQGLALGTYDAKLNEAGDRISNGTWVGGGGIPGGWSAEHQAVGLPDLTQEGWRIVDSVDDAGRVWDGSLLTFTSQTPNGSNFDLEGSFTWNSTPPPFAGTENFNGTLFADGRLVLQGTELENAVGIVLGTYLAELNEAGDRIVNGVSSSAGGVTGQWSADPLGVSELTGQPGRHIVRGVLVIIDDEAGIEYEPFVGSW